MESFEIQKKRRSSFFRRQEQSDAEEENISCHSGQTASDEIAADCELDENVIKQYIEKLKTEKKNWIAEYNKIKSLHQKYKKEKMNKVKLSKADVFALLTEQEKQKYQTLFEEDTFSSLIESFDQLKKKVAIESVRFETMKKSYISLAESSNQARFDNLMSRLSQWNVSIDQAYESDAASFSDCIDSSDDFDDSGME